MIDTARTHFPGDLLLGNPDSPVALCVHWTPKDLYKNLLDRVCVVGSMYSREAGVARMIANVLANPQIKVVILTGQEHPDKRMRVATDLMSQSFTEAELGIPQKYIEEFYDRTWCMDMRVVSHKDEGMIRRNIAAAEDYAYSSHIPEPIYIDLPIPTAQIYPSNVSGALIRGRDLAEVHTNILREIRTFGTTFTDDQGHVRQSLWQVMSVLDAKTQDYEAVPFATKEEVLRYGYELRHGTENLEVKYQYGRLMTEKFGVNQIEEAIKILRATPDSTRPVISLWNPSNGMNAKDGPCMVLVHPTIRDSALHLCAYFRTQDMYLGYPRNAAGLIELLRQMAEELGVEVGTVTLVSANAHFYDHNFGDVDKYLVQTRPHVLRLDAKGNWNFSKTSNDYVADLYSGGAHILQIKRNTKAQLVRAVALHTSDVEHALYVGGKISEL